jgi:hypothetical protein
MKFNPKTLIYHSFNVKKETNLTCYTMVENQIYRFNISVSFGNMDIFDCNSSILRHEFKFHYDKNAVGIPVSYSEFVDALPPMFNRDEYIKKARPAKIKEIGL